MRQIFFARHGLTGFHDDLRKSPIRKNIPKCLYDIFSLAAFNYFCSFISFNKR